MAEGVSLRELLTLEPLRGARVVAGAAGLDRMVRQVNVMEVPDIINWVKPNELLLTTTYPLRDDQAALAELVPKLAEKELAGLAVKPARYIDSIPNSMIEAAERFGFPLLELPPETSFDDIINIVLGVILNVQALRLRRSAAIHDRFTRIVLSGGGLRQIAQALAELVSRPVAIVDAEGAVLTRSADAVLDRLPPATSQSRLAPPAGSSSLRWVELDAGSGISCVGVQPIVVSGDLHGAVVVVAEPSSMGEEEQEAVEHAATVAALRLVQARAVAEADRRFQTVCLEELVTGHVADRAVLKERAVAFGWDLGVARSVLVAELEEVGGRRFAEMAGTADEASARHRLAEAASVVFGKAAIAWERSTGVAALLASGSKRQAGLKDTAGQLQAEAGRRIPGCVIGVGIGRSCGDPLDLQHSFSEALRALEVGRWARGTGKISIFEELGLDRLLISCPDVELAAFCDAAIGPLAAYDLRHKTDLLGTLEAYLASGGNAATTARTLYVHYNTLKNRLDRIEEVVGTLSGQPERQLSLALALRIRRLRGG